MKKIINKPEDAVTELIDGFVRAYPRFYKQVPGQKGVVLKHKKENKVALLIGGGSGHEPMFAGFVGEGLADGAALGPIFTSPDPNTILETIKQIDAGKGVLCVYGNYEGDNLNFSMAAELASFDGIDVKIVTVIDDVASAPRERLEDRRGIAGDVYVMKIAGAATDLGYDLDAAVAATQKARAAVKSIGIALQAGTIPGQKPTFTLPDDEMEFGMGIHGEPGIKRAKMDTADKMVDEMMDTLLADCDYKPGDEVCVLLNGLGSTTILELAIMFRRVEDILREQGVVIYDSELQSYCTTQEMAGASITCMKLDNELKKLYDHPAYSPYYTKR